MVVVRLVVAHCRLIKGRRGGAQQKGVYNRDGVEGKKRFETINPSLGTP